MKESLNHQPKEEFTAVNGIMDGICQRCHSPVNPENCDEYGRLYCSECIDYGMVREDSILYRYPRHVSSKEHELVLSFPLSKKQKEASLFVLNCLLRKQSGFLYAVCGSGKTEILYEALLEAMKNGLRVCIAIPRKDIVVELALRLEKVFPKSVIKPLYEKAKDDSDADILISTIHQLIRYDQEFDWIVLDEADAFPYRNNPFLHRLVRKALKKDGVLFQMSATLNKETKAELKQDRSDSFSIPARFHQAALDLPKCVQIENLYKGIMSESTLSKTICGWLSKRVFESKQALLFVPSIRYGEKLCSLLNENGYSAGNLSSLSENGANILRDFRNKRWNFLCSTTILERGMTFKNIDCAIFSAEKAVFDYGTLVQICGRVGRNPLYRHGEIRYFCEEKTMAMKRSIDYIRKMNHKGKKEGLISDDL